jgi:hypothetical protein
MKSTYRTSPQHPHSYSSADSVCHAVRSEPAISSFEVGFQITLFLIYIRCNCNVANSSVYSIPRHLFDQVEAFSTAVERAEHSFEISWLAPDFA